MHGRTWFPLLAQRSRGTNASPAGNQGAHRRGANCTSFQSRLGSTKRHRTAVSTPSTSGCSPYAENSAAVGYCAPVQGEPADQNRRSWLLEKLRGPDVCAPDSAVRLVDRLCGLYAEHGLFDGDRARPLDCDCLDSGGCWGGIAAEHHPPREWAPISVPWIGPRYQPGGVAAVAINFHDYGGLGAQWWIRRGANDKLRQGKHGGFEYRAGTYLALVQAALAGVPLDEQPDPMRAAEAWDRCAFLEAVKCSPRSGVSEPTEAMRRNCPARYLADELNLLGPGVLVIIGRWVGDTVAAPMGIDREEELPGLWRGKAALAGRAIDVVCLNHPGQATGNRRWSHSGRRSSGARRARRTEEPAGWHAYLEFPGRAHPSVTCRPSWFGQARSVWIAPGAASRGWRRRRWRSRSGAPRGRGPSAPKLINAVARHVGATRKPSPIRAVRLAARDPYLIPSRCKP